MVITVTKKQLLVGTVAFFAIPAVISTSLSGIRALWITPPFTLGILAVFLIPALALAVGTAHPGTPGKQVLLKTAGTNH
jgi:hypothetical protein